jgi:hypothetical protein
MELLVEQLMFLVFEEHELKNVDVDCLTEAVIFVFILEALVGFEELLNFLFADDKAAEEIFN